MSDNPKNPPEPIRKPGDKVPSPGRDTPPGPSHPGGQTPTGTPGQTTGDK